MPTKLCGYCDKPYAPTIRTDYDTTTFCSESCQNAVDRLIVRALRLDQRERERKKLAS